MTPRAAELREALQRAEAERDSAQTLLSHMSHELRGPLTAIIGMADLILDTQLTPDQREMLGVVQPRSTTDLEKIETQELFQFVQKETFSDDVILFFKPRVLALFTDRKSLAMAIPDPGGDLLRWTTLV